MSSSFSMSIVLSTAELLSSSDSFPLSASSAFYSSSLPGVHSLISCQLFLEDSPRSPCMVLIVIVLDSQSATMFCFPGLYVMFTFYSFRNSFQHVTLGEDSFSSPTQSSVIGVDPKSVVFTMTSNGNLSASKTILLISFQFLIKILLPLSPSSGYQF